MAVPAWWKNVSTETWTVIVVATLVVGFLVYRLWTRGTYHKDAGSGGVEGRTVYLVVASWCPHCQRANPDFDAFAKRVHTDLPGIGVHIIDVENASEGEKQIVETLGVRGFPSVQFVHANGKAHVYKGERKAEPMFAFAKRFFSA